MLGRIAKLYYEHGLTHQEIADLVGWSRVKVTRGLAEARELGIVQITVVSDEAIFVEEESHLRKRFGLEIVALSPSVAAPEGSVSALSRVGAECICQHVTNGMHVAVGLSKTLAGIASIVEPDPQPDTVFVPLQGTNPGLVVPPTPSNIALEFATRFQGNAHALSAPVFASSPEILKILNDDENFSRGFDMARACDLALVGVGGTALDSSILLGGNRLTEEDAAEIRATGAAGDINARFFDKAGQPLETAQSALVLGLTLDEFVKIPVRIAAAAGPAKVEALHAALTGGLVNGLITDDVTAKELLALP